MINLLLLLLVVTDLRSVPTPSREWRVVQSDVVDKTIWLLLPSAKILDRHVMRLTNDWESYLDRCCCSGEAWILHPPSLISWQIAPPCGPRVLLMSRYHLDKDWI